MGDLLLCRRRGHDVAIEANVQSCMIVALRHAEYNEGVQCGATLQDEMETETDSQPTSGRTSRMLYVLRNTRLGAPT
jgi:hypothetical protein